MRDTVRASGSPLAVSSCRNGSSKWLRAEWFMVRKSQATVVHRQCEAKRKHREMHPDAAEGRAAQIDCQLVAEQDAQQVLIRLELLHNFGENFFLQQWFSLDFSNGLL